MEERSSSSMTSDRPGGEVEDTRTSAPETDSIRQNSINNNKSLFEEWLSQKSGTDISIHRGHLLMATSLSFGVLCYRAYHRPLDEIIQKSLKDRAVPQTTLANLETASDDIKRAIGSIAAVRALRVATLGTGAVFAFTGALSLYATGCTTFQDFFVITRRWAVTKRQKLDDVLGVDQRINRDLHPDFAATRGMTEEEELDYVYKTYFPLEEMAESDGEQEKPPANNKPP